MRAKMDKIKSFEVIAWACFIMNRIAITEKAKKPTKKFAADSKNEPSPSGFDGTKATIAAVHATGTMRKNVQQFLSRTADKISRIRPMAKLDIPIMNL